MKFQLEKKVSEYRIILIEFGIKKRREWKNVSKNYEKHNNDNDDHCDCTGKKRSDNIGSISN